MHFDNDIHLAYSTNIHRGNSWEETFSSLQNDMLQVRERLGAEEKPLRSGCGRTTSPIYLRCTGEKPLRSGFSRTTSPIHLRCTGEEKPFGIGLRLSNQASLELSDRERLTEFRRWLDANHCYVFTINGFPYGQFHGTRVKEQVYVPDWQSGERLEYTNRLFTLLAELLPPGAEGSVSTLPGSFKPFITDPSQVETMKRNLIECARHIESLSEARDLDLHLGLEPEPFGYLETTREAIDFFRDLSERSLDQDLIRRRIGINYDTCHMAIQFETAAASLARLVENRIRISKVHLSSALRVVPTEEVRRGLRDFIDPVYLHQVVSRDSAGVMARWMDLDQALEAEPDQSGPDAEWRIHFHVPLYARPDQGMDTTIGHLEAALDYLAGHRDFCHHYEFETYTWEVLPARMRSDSVVDQLVAEYQWCIDAFTARGINRRI